MMKLVDLNYFTHSANDLKAVEGAFATSYEYAKILSEKMAVTIVKHLKSEDSLTENNIIYKGFKGSNKFYRIPFASHAYIKSTRPDIVISQGLIFPLHILALRFKLGIKTKIILQHHGERPFKNPIKRWLQKIADKCVDAYMFTSLGNASIWVVQGVIRTIDKCHEVLEASTFIKRTDKDEARTTLGITCNNMFLWVGRLNMAKDPLSVLKGFEEYLKADKKDAVLYMIFQDDELLPDVKQYIARSEVLPKHVMLVGEVVHAKLTDWYSASDYFVSGSHREGSGYALIECMSCGCIPIVTDIPPFRKITADGSLALLFKAGDADDCRRAFEKTNVIDKSALQQKIQKHFEDKLSFVAIADDVYSLCLKLLNK